MANDQKFRVTRSGVTFGGRVLAEGDVIGYKDFPSYKRDEFFEMAVNGDMEHFLEPASADDADAPSTDGGAAVATEQPQGEPDARIAGDSEEAQMAKEYKNKETSGSLFIEEVTGKTAEEMVVEGSEPAAAEEAAEEPREAAPRRNNRRVAERVEEPVHVVTEPNNPQPNPEG